MRTENKANKQDRRLSHRRAGRGNEWIGCGDGATEDIIRKCIDKRELRTSITMFLPYLGIHEERGFAVHNVSRSSDSPSTETFAI